jgi:hypothetical protein
MPYSFRVRINRCPSTTINSDAVLVTLPVEIPNVSLSLRSASGRESIREAQRWVLLGQGFASAEEAKEMGMRLQDALIIALSKARIAADFGERLPDRGFSELDREPLSGTVLREYDGVQVYLPPPEPMFVSAGFAKVRTAKGPKILEDAFRATLSQNRVLTDRERVAYSLFSDAFFQQSTEGRFLLLVMAVEAVIAPSPKSTEAVHYVERFIRQLENSRIDPKEKRSLIGSAEWLREESINQAGRRLAEEKLGTQKYADLPAPTFFSRVYSLRSRLVHGKTPFPTPHEIGRLSGHLENFVCDLLAAADHPPAETRKSRRSRRAAFASCIRTKV